MQLQLIASVNAVYNIGIRYDQCLNIYFHA